MKGMYSGASGQPTKVGRRMGSQSWDMASVTSKSG